MRVRRTLACALAAGLVLSACNASENGNDATDEDAGSAAPEGDVDPGDLAGTLTLSGTASDRPAIEAVIELFEAEYPDITVQASFADTEPYQAALRTELSAGTAPDVMFAWPGNGNPGAIQLLAPEGVLADLSDRPWAADVPEGFRPVVEVEGELLVLPMAFSGIGPIYNQTVMDQLGAEQPTTWTELLDFCQTAQDEGVVAFALGNQADWVTQLIAYSLVATNVYSDNPDFDDQMAAGEATFVDSAWTQSMEQYLEMEEAGCFQPDPVGTSYETSIELVSGDEAAAVVQGTWAIALLEEQAPDTEFVLGALPATDDADETMMPAAPSGTFAVNADPDEPDLAYAFIDFLATPEAVNAFATTGGSLPGIPNDEYDVPDTLSLLVEYQEAGRTVPFMDQQWPNPRVQEAHLTGVQELFSDQASIEDILQAMDDAYARG
ncbi:extracellular solute-binding protein [Nitriliruptoraceae bacterium ZYF776]|nr:extracellular solute-binding protein [Profundirhabdus halotolerans]